MTLSSSPVDQGASNRRSSAKSSRDVGGEPARSPQRTRHRGSSSGVDSSRHGREYTSSRILPREAKSSARHDPYSASSSSISQPRLSSAPPAQPLNKKHNSKSKKEKSPHIYTREQERFIAELLAQPSNWNLLSVPTEDGSDTNNNVTKTALRKNLIRDFNGKFNLELDDRQLKNKITTMERAWRTAHQEYRSASGSSDGSDQSAEALKSRLLRMCHFYYILFPSASKSTKLNPPEVPQSASASSSKKPETRLDDNRSVEEDEIIEDDDENNNEGVQGERWESMEYEDTNARMHKGGGVELHEPTNAALERTDQPHSRQILQDVEYQGEHQEVMKPWDTSERHEHEPYGHLATDHMGYSASDLDMQRRQLDMQQQQLDIQHQQLETDTRIKLIQEQIAMANLKKAQELARKAKTEADTAELDLELKKLEVERKRAEIERMKTNPLINTKQSIDNQS
ncbi:hypothetical protein BGZ49_008271 [Haplosporangium sp. Z 27]|nr:hypothetical protein BGZ49_008271 [Haplosporangium sp. Z 27]